MLANVNRLRLFARLSAVAAFMSTAFLGLPCLGGATPPSGDSARAPVGRLDTNRFATPTNQILTPAGIQVELPGMRPQALALSPDGRLLVTAGKTHELVVVEASTGRML